MVKTQPHSSVAKRDSWRPGTGLRVSSLCSEPSFYGFTTSLEDCLFANGVDSWCQGLPGGGVSCLASGIIQAASALQSFVAIAGRGPADDIGAPGTTVMPEVLLPVSALHLHLLLHSSRAGIITLPSRGRNCGRQVMQFPEGCSLTRRKEGGLLTPPDSQLSRSPLQPLKTFQPEEADSSWCCVHHPTRVLRWTLFPPPCEIKLNS